MTLRSAEEHYQQQAALTLAITRQVDRYWRQVRPQDINAWADLLPTVAPLVAAGQVAAASNGIPYVERALAEQGVAVAPEAVVSAAGFAAMANGPLPVLDLLDLPRIQTLERISQGMDTNRSLEIGRNQVTTFAASLIQDAGRQATSAAIYVRPTIGYRRMVNPPCCERCAILAGKWFRSNTGFLRHPRCDCRHVPAAEDSPGDVATSPRALFDSGQVRGVREAEAKAIADGADPLQVINARRGAQGMFTTEGVTRRGVAGRLLIERGGSVRQRVGTAQRLTRDGLQTRTITARRARLRRPTPDAIYEFAVDREDAINLLRQNGYILSR